MEVYLDKRIWISWEDHRRSRVLSKEFECKYLPLVSSSNSRVIRYPVLAIRTIGVLFKKRPAYVFCQNPSIILAALCTLLKPLFKYTLVVDRHSNFKFDTLTKRSVKWKLFHAISDFSLKKSDLTLVTNRHLKEHVEKKGGKALVLQDKIPELEVGINAPRFMLDSNKYRIVCVTAFDEDEPIAELIEAGKALSGYYKLYMTGNYLKVVTEKEKEECSAQGIYFCGFLDEESYVDALAHCDAIVVLTKKEYILNCGAYEAFSVNKPVILADTATLKEYFGEGPVYANPNDSKSIKSAIITAVENRELIEDVIQERRLELIGAWKMTFDMIRDQLGQLELK